MLKMIFGPWTYERKRFIKAFAESIPVGEKVLDAGAGTCKYKNLFTHAEYKAQDFGAYEGKEHVYGKLDYISDITAIPVADGSFNYLMCTEVLEHLPRPDLAIKEFARILPAGGEMILTAPLGSGIHMAPYHFYGGFTPYWYQHFLPKYGFEIKSIQECGKFFRTYGAESQRFLSKLTPRGKITYPLSLPFIAVLALWFRLTLPVICYLLDQYVYDFKEYTAGYFVKAVKL